jgi:hypothetical protein
MDLYLVKHLRSLNRILAMPIVQLKHEYEVFSESEDKRKSLSEEQREYVHDLIANKPSYQRWLLSVITKEDSYTERLLKLFGEHNVQRKLEFLNSFVSDNSEEQEKIDEYRNY